MKIKSFIGDLIPYRNSYSNKRQAESAWQSGVDFKLKSKGHCLDGLLVNRNCFDQSDNFRLFLQGEHGKFVEVTG